MTDSEKKLKAEVLLLQLEVIRLQKLLAQIHVGLKALKF